MKLANPCIDCGEPTTNGTRCSDCESKAARLRPPRTTPYPAKKTTAAQRGYGSAWTRLSKLARQQQPFCSDCGSTEDLQCDHTPEAWERHEKGLPLRLEDVDVVCGACNRRRGAARGKHARKPSDATNNPPRYGSASWSR